MMSLENWFLEIIEVSIRKIEWIIEFGFKKA